jgi:hypothetical protein
MWSSQKRCTEWTHFSHYIDWNATWLYFNNNQKSSNHFTNPKLNHQKSFKIKLLLNNLPTYSHFHTIYPEKFTSPNCFHCNLPDSPLHWLSCQNSSLLHEIIHSVIHEVTKSLELLPTQLDKLVQLILTHPAFNPNPSFLHPYSLNSTLKGLIPRPLIEEIQPFDLSYKQASQVIIKILLKLSEEIYEQIWKPYCTSFAQWKRTNKISSKYKRTQTQQQHPSHKKSHQHRTFTFSCLCGLPDQLHSDSNNCPPIGQALRKVSIWSIMWIKYSTPTNSILTIQI